MKVESIVESILQYFWPALNDKFVISLEKLLRVAVLHRFYCSSIPQSLGKTVVFTKIRNRYNQAPHLTRDTIWESDKNTRKHNTQESQEVTPLPTGGHTAVRNRPDSKRNTNMKHN